MGAGNLGTLGGGGGGFGGWGGGGGGGGGGRLLPPQIPRIEPYLISISHHTHAPIDHVFFRKLRDTCARVGANFATITLDEKTDLPL